MNRPLWTFFTRPLVGVFLLVGSLAVFGPLHASPAHAQITLLECKGTESVQYDPGITYTEREITVTGNDTVSTCGLIHSALTPGTDDWEFTAMRSCLASVPDPGPITINWRNGDYSTINFTTASSNNVNGEVEVISLGTVTSGFGAGAQAQETLTL